MVLSRSLAMGTLVLGLIVLVFGVLFGGGFSTALLSNSLLWVALALLWIAVSYFLGVANPALWLILGGIALAVLAFLGTGQLLVAVLGLIVLVLGILIMAGVATVETAPSTGT